MGKRKLTQCEFEIATTAMDAAQSVGYAKLVLVDGVSAAEVAKQHGVSREAVYQGVRRVLAEYERQQEESGGWQKIELHLPPHLVDTVKAIEAAAKKELKKSAK